MVLSARGSDNRDSEGVSGSDEPAQNRGRSCPTETLGRMIGHLRHRKDYRDSY